MSRAWVPGTAGEIVQGFVDGHHLHVSAPIDRFSAARYIPGSGLLDCPPDRPKARQAIERYASRSGLPIGGTLQIDSALPPGKGLGSSTADAGAALFAFARALGRDLTPAECAAACLEIDPTDGSLFPGIVIFDHRTGDYLELLGDPPPVTLLLIDTGGTVDTLEYNRVDRTELLRTNEPVIRAALECARAACRERDPRLLGEAATMSARAHQAILPKNHFYAISTIVQDAGAVGISAAHSGTVLAALFDARTVDLAAACHFVKRRLGRAPTPARLVGGGPRYVLPEERQFLPLSAAQP